MNKMFVQYISSKADHGDIPQSNISYRTPLTAMQFMQIWNRDWLGGNKMCEAKIRPVQSFNGAQC